MSEFFKVFDAVGSVTVQQVLAFAALIIPGFIALRVYELRGGGESRKANEFLIDVIVYSFATDVLAFGALAFVSTFVPPAAQVPARAAVAFTALVVLPVALAFAWSALHERMIRYDIFRDTASDPWYRIFERVSKERLDLAVVVTLRDGRKLGARLRRPSRAPSYSGDRYVALGEVWTVDQEHATFVGARPGSVGILIDKSDCETIEFVRWAQADRADTNESTGTKA